MVRGQLLTAFRSSGLMTGAFIHAEPNVKLHSIGNVTLYLHPLVLSGSKSFLVVLLVAD